MKILMIGLLIALLAAAAGIYYLKFHSTPIGDLLANPRNYENEIVTIAGRVVESQSLIVLMDRRDKLSDPRRNLWSQLTPSAVLIPLRLLIRCNM